MAAREDRLAHVLDHDRLAELALQRVGDVARDELGAAARRIAEDPAHHGEDHPPDDQAFWVPLIRKLGITVD